MSMFTYTADQQKAAEYIEHWFNKESRQIFVLTGYAGTGKTTLLKHVIPEDLELVPDETAVFVTPTGKAATVLLRKGIPASTVHHLIYDTEVHYKTVTVDGRDERVAELCFTKKDRLDPKIRLIVLDEASMVSDDMLKDLSSYGVKILACGDSAQLPPVEDENTLLDKPDFTLKTVVRQANGNPIIQLSQIVREGKMPEYGRYGDSVKVISRHKTDHEELKSLMLASDVIICRFNDTRARINGDMRTILGRGTSLPQRGEKIICTSNNWAEYVDRSQKYCLVNGLCGTAEDVTYDLDQGIGFAKFVPEFDKGIKPYVIPFDVGKFTRGSRLHGSDDYFRSPLAKGLRCGNEAFKLNEFEYGYCVTCHKAQGSEYDKVLVFDESMSFNDRFSWLYTAITRAKKELVIVR
ncbi:MAG: AAA family ATPase [Bacteroidales bacterium]|nr:AAA family ATPase [Bacteroidales bacterium]